MARFTEFLLQGEDGGTVLINPANVAAFEPRFEPQSDLWIGCAAHLVSGKVLMLNASIEQIEGVLRESENVPGWIREQDTRK